MEKIYYLDNAATTRMFDEVKNVSSNFLCDEFYNPSAVYNKSVNVRRVVEDARRYILENLGALSGSLIFTGSATEANNMVVFSQRNFAGKKFLFSAGEHPSVMECAKQLKARGYDVQIIPLEKSGRVDVEIY